MNDFMRSRGPVSHPNEQMADASVTDRQARESRMRKRTSYPARHQEAPAQTTAQALVQVLTAAMTSWAATLRLTVTCVALVLATAAAAIIIDHLGR